MLNFEIPLHQIQMVQKRHQEEISGPSNSLADALTAEELPRPKRTRKQSQKALENDSQKKLFLVPAPTSTPAELSQSGQT